MLSKFKPARKVSNSKPEIVEKNHQCLTVKQPAAMIEYKTGPDKRGPKYCIKCQKSFKAGEAWRRVWDPEHAYAIGVHTVCPESNHK